MATFGEKLKAVLDRKKMGVRTLANQLAQGDPVRRESIRRRLNKYIHENTGATEALRHEIEDVLELKRDELAGDDEEEPSQVDELLLNAARAFAEAIKAQVAA